MNEPAFPQIRTLPDGSHEECEGLTLRDYFAARAMQAFIVKGVIPADGLNKKQAITVMAYETADAMLED